jgi:hypothetical protein
LKTGVVGKNVKHLAGLFGEDGASIMVLLDDSGFVPSAGRTNATSADHISACVQPSRRVAPMLIPEGLGPSTHLAVALGLQHPFIRNPASSLLEQSTLLKQHSAASDMVAFRLKAVDILFRLCDELKLEYESWLPYVHPDIRPIVARRHIPFCREVSLVTGFGDMCLWPAYVLGLRMSGWAEPSSVSPAKVTAPACDENAYATSTLVNNRRVIDAMGSSGDAKLDHASWEKSKKEFEVKTLLGPFSLCDILSNVRLLPRRPIWEMHGGKVEPSVRNIDDGLFGEQNDTVGLTSVHRPCTVDKLVSRGRFRGDFQTSNFLDLRLTLVVRTDKSQVTRISHICSA